MKHLILTSALFLTATLGFAQNITEPEYKGQVAVINADSTTTLLQKETGEHKAKSSAFALVPIPGASLLDRTKAYLTVKGAESPNKISSKDSATNRRHGCMTNIMGDKPLCNCVKDK